MYIVTLRTSAGDISPSDWEAVTFVCKHMENLSRFNLNDIGSDCLKEILKLLQIRCIDQLTLSARDYFGVEHVLGVLYIGILRNSDLKKIRICL